MSVIDYIEKAQQSSVSKRKAVLVISTAVLMSVIIAIWIMQFRLPISDEVALSSLPGVEKPFTLLLSYFKDFFWSDTDPEGELYIPNQDYEF